MPSPKKSRLPVFAALSSLRGGCVGSEEKYEKKKWGKASELQRGRQTEDGAHHGRDCRSCCCIGVVDAAAFASAAEALI